MQVRVPTKACSCFIFSFFYYNVATTLQQPCSNLATTLQQGCNSFNSMVFATLWQPCSKVVVDNLATGLQQGCSKLVTLVWARALIDFHSFSSSILDIHVHMYQGVQIYNYTSWLLYNTSYQ